ncbi:MAG: hypothetical protein R3E32_16505 [Chitinophagales bacterium]
MNIFKHFLKIVSIGFLLLLLCVFADLQFTRGYFLKYVTAMPQMGEITEDILGSFEYHIQKKENGNFDCTIRNNSIFPVNLIVYRNEAFFYNIEDSTLFDVGYATRVRLNLPHGIVEENSGFDCGTGIGLATINPFEKFQQEDIFETLANDHFIQSSLLEPIINGDSLLAIPPLIFDKTKSNFVFTGTDKRNVNYKDSLELKFYLPIYSIFTGKQFNLYSNCIKLSYLDLIERIVRNHNQRIQFNKITKQ